MVVGWILGSSAGGRYALALAIAGGGLIAIPALAAGSREAPPPQPVEADEPSQVDEPAFPGVRYREVFRLRVQSRFLPASDFGPADVTLYQPELRLRATLPLSQRAVLQLLARGGTSRYEFSGESDLLGLGPAPGDPFDDFYDASVSLQGALLLNEERHLFAKGERWSLLASVFGRSRWEVGAFADGITEGGSLGLGYEIPERLRLGVGASLASDISGSGIDVSPVFTIRWRVTKALTARNRGQGLQIEYRLRDNLEVFASGFLSSDEFRLAGPIDATLRDRQVLAGAGFEWKITKHLRINAEAGAVPWRELRVRARKLGSLGSMRADLSPYADIRFEVRP